tara:strand:+ start:2886 stop:3173 length:288 start_codon:yes stop_codon:yes gene_type:complete
MSSDLSFVVSFALGQNLVNNALQLSKVLLDVGQGTASNSGLHLPHLLQQSFFAGVGFGHRSPKARRHPLEHFTHRPTGRFNLEALLLAVLKKEQL